MNQPHDREPAHKPGFWQRPMVQTVLPFLTSLTFHGTLVAIALLTVQVIVNPPKMLVSVAPDVTPEGIVDLNKPLVPANFKELVPAHSDRDKPETDPFQDLIPDITNSKSHNLVRGNNAIHNALANLGGAEDGLTEPATIGIGGTRSSLAKSGKNGIAGNGENTEGGWEVANTGPLQKGNVTLLDMPGRARKVVFLCDATGSMQPIFAGLRAELDRAVGNLDQLQWFNVIFFSDERVLSFQPTLAKGTADNKTKVRAFLGDVQPRGLTNPLPAIRAAFAQQPELIYVLTDGFDQVGNFDDVYNEFKTLNKDRKVQVNTILIGSPDQKDLVDILKRIAADNKGVMKVVSREEF